VEVEKVVARIGICSDGGSLLIANQRGSVIMKSAIPSGPFLRVSKLPNRMFRPLPAVMPWCDCTSEPAVLRIVMFALLIVSDFERILVTVVTSLCKRACLHVRRSEQRHEEIH
jgi:hypothetical protein